MCLSQINQLKHFAIWQKNEGPALARRAPNSLKVFVYYYSIYQFYENNSKFNVQRQVSLIASY